jgi:dGTPase
MTGDPDFSDPVFCTREELEAEEERTLAPYAIPSGASEGRVHPETRDVFRTEFQRDRDRVIHSTAFRRLIGKTQVFVSDAGDHYRTRLTHSIEVSQIARSVARSLRLNQDLVEAVALAHDLGHAPFGHSGGEALDELMRDAGGFEHNYQSLRIVERLESKYPGFDGLNLAYEVRESILKHKRPFRHPIYAPYRPEHGPLLEADVVDVADGIAYNSHDLDDGLRAGLLEAEELEATGLWRAVKDRVLSRFPKLEGRELVKKIVPGVIDFLVKDLVKSTAARLAAEGVATRDDVRKATRPLVGFSDEVARLEAELKAFLYERFYTHHKVARMRHRSKVFLRALFGAYVENPKLMPPRYRALAETDGLHRAVADYVSGMTDGYAQTEYRRLFDPGSRSYEAP